MCIRRLLCLAISTKVAVTPSAVMISIFSFLVYYISSKFVSETGNRDTPAHQRTKKCLKICDIEVCTSPAGISKLSFIFTLFFF